MAKITVFLSAGNSGPREQSIGGWENSASRIGKRVHEGEPLKPREVLQYGQEYYRVEAGNYETNEYHARRCLSWPNARRIENWVVEA